MNEISLLDCTLRDGGYVNDWKFGCGSIKSIFSRLDLAGIDIIEIGFIDERRGFDENRSIFPNIESVSSVFKNICKPKSLISVMIDYGTCNICNIYDFDNSCIDIIRVIFKKNIQDDALQYIKNIKEKGYYVIANPVSITGYSDDDLYVIIDKINKIQPYAVTIVDTYGLMHSNRLLHYCNIVNDRLDANIRIGYHAHNNFQMAYSNCISVMENIHNRDLIIDGTLYGMGKSAGNACTELLAMYMNDFRDSQYDIDQLQEAIDIDIQKEYNKKSWGYKPLFYLSALMECHPNYVKYFLDKKTLSIKNINELLEKIPFEKKLTFDKELADNIYNYCQNIEINDSNTIMNLSLYFNNKKILLLGPGKSIISEQKKILDYISKISPIVVSINFLAEQYPIDFVFIGNPKRYSQFFNKIYDSRLNVKLICSSNITEAREKIDYIINYKRLLSNCDIIRDNPLIMFLNFIKNFINVDVVLAGFDGFYKSNECNYYSDYIQFLYCSDDVMSRNDAIASEIKALSCRLHISTLTASKYFNE